MSRPAVGYSRLSQDSDTSIDRQKDHIREYADEHGLDLEQIYDDGERSSGFETETREEYQELRDRVQSGSVGAVVVNDKRRLARDFDETMRLILDCRQEDVELHTYQSGELDLTDPMQASIEVLQAASEHESKMKEIERAREAVRERQNQGFWQGRPPFGLELDDAGEHLQPSDKFHVAIDILERRDEGATYSEIAEETGVSKSTAHRVVDRREQYQQHAE